MKEIRAWAEEVVKECEKKGLIIRTRGRSGGTYAHWKIATAYASYLSPELHNVVISIFQERVEETVNPELAFDRGYERTIKTWKIQHDGRWIDRREKGIAKRNEFTATLGAHGVRDRGGDVST